MVTLVSWTCKLSTHVFSLYSYCIIFGILESVSLAQIDVCRKSTTDLWFYDVTPEKCYEECRSRSSCQGVNYHLTMGACYLSMDQNGEREFCRDFLYSDRSTWDLTMTEACQAADCSDSKVCVTAGENVSCEYRECPVPSALLNGQVLGNQRYIGACVSHLCDVNYVLIGSPSLECNDDGQWKPDETQGTGRLPQCKPACTTPTMVQDASIKGEGMYEGRWIEYVCSSGYVLSGPGNFKCTAEGTWETETGGTELPECLEACVTPPDIENGTWSGDDVAVGSHITYSCQGEYKLVGPSVFNCAETRNWVPDGPCSMDDSVDALLTSPPRCVIENCQVKLREAYVIHDDYTPWTDAAATCRQNGGHLVSFSCETEYLFVKSFLLPEVYAYHIGATDMDIGCYWKWIDSPDEFTFAVWSPGEPNNSGGVEHSTLLAMHDGSFADISSSSGRPFVCEMEQNN